MSIQSQDFVALGQAQFDKAVRLSSLFISSAERVANLQLELSRKVLADNAQTLKALTEVKDAKSLSDLQASKVQPSIDQAFTTARQVYDVAVATQNEITALFEEQIADLNKSVLTTLDQLAKNAPAGSDVAVNALKNFVTTTNAAFESVTETARKVGSELAEAGVEAASNSVKAAGAAAARTKKATV
ncbi:phasin family protein [Neisseriaceae bacterium JH1-16]|nr:phasin family protein [Neisseriaceae bacterium JH1-16]